MSPLRLTGSTSGYSQIDAPAVAGDQTFTLPGTGGTLVTTNTLPASGKILQVVNATYSTVTSNSTSTFADTGLTATITPTSASSKILVLVNQNGIYKVTNNTAAAFRLLRGATSILLFEDLSGYTSSTAANAIGSVSTCYLDSPATTSATTYKTQFMSGANNALIFIQNYYSVVGGSAATMTLMEVAA